MIRLHTKDVHYAICFLFIECHTGIISKPVNQNLVAVLQIEINILIFTLHEWTHGTYI